MNPKALSDELPGGLEWAFAKATQGLQLRQATCVLRLAKHVGKEFFHLLPRLLVGGLVVLNVGYVMAIGIGIGEGMMCTFIFDHLIFRAGIFHLVFEFQPRGHYIQRRFFSPLNLNPR